MSRDSVLEHKLVYSEELRLRLLSSFLIKALERAKSLNNEEGLEERNKFIKESIDEILVGISLRLEGKLDMIDETDTDFNLLSFRAYIKQVERLANLDPSNEYIKDFLSGAKKVYHSLATPENNERLNPNDVSDSEG